MVCSLYDLVAKEHGPLFTAKSEPLLQRAVRGFMAQATNVRPDDFVVRVHGTIEHESVDGGFDDTPSAFFSAAGFRLSPSEFDDLVKQHE